MLTGGLIDAAEKLKTELEEEKKERELQERLEKEKEERDGATEELANAVTAARESRDAAILVKPIKRAKKVRAQPDGERRPPRTAPCARLTQPALTLGCVCDLWRPPSPPRRREPPSPPS